MLLKTLTPITDSGWGDRALGIESQTLWVELVGMATVSRATSHSTNWSLVCSLLRPSGLPTSQSPPWTPGEYRASSLWGPIQFLWWLRWKARESYFVVWKVEQRPLFASTVVFWRQDFWNRNFKGKWSNNYRESTFFFFYKAHAYDLLSWVGFRPVHEQCCISVPKATQTSLHTSTLELRFLSHRWPRFKCYLTDRLFLVALLPCGKFFVLFCFVFFKVHPIWAAWVGVGEGRGTHFGAGGTDNFFKKIAQKKNECWNDSFSV